MREENLIMNRYETLLLLHTEITDDDTASVERQFEKIITTANGSVDSLDNWGKCKLSYPINKSLYGIYLLIRYKLPATVAKETFGNIDHFMRLKCNELVSRYITIKIELDAPADYARPEPAGSARNGGTDQFFKDKKIETLLQTVDSSKQGRPEDSMLDAEIDIEEQHIDNDIDDNHNEG